MPEKRIPERPALPRALVAFLVLVILFTGLSVASMLRQRLLTGHFRAFEALAPPLPGVDFYVYQDRMSLIHHEAFFTQPGLPWMYPAPAAPLYALLYRFCYHGAWIPGWCVLAALTLTGCVFGVYRLSRAAQTKGAGVFFALSLPLAWPVYLSLQRGNIESLLWLMLAAGVWAFAKERWWIAAALIGFAGAFKFYPLICLGLFLPQRRWKEIALGVGVMSAVSVASLWFVNPDLGLAARQISAGVRLFTETYAGGVGRSQGIYDHSAFELVKVMVRPPSAGMQHLLHLYLVSAGAGMLGLFSFECCGCRF